MFELHLSYDTILDIKRSVRPFQHYSNLIVDMSNNILSNAELVDEGEEYLDEVISSTLDNIYYNDFDDAKFINDRVSEESENYNAVYDETMDSIVEILHSLIHSLACDILNYEDMISRCLYYRQGVLYCESKGESS